MLEIRIAFCELEPWEKDFFRKRLSKHRLFFIEGTLAAKNVNGIRNAEALCTFIYSSINKSVLAKLPKLKLVSTMSTGFDHIDLGACRKRGITVCNVPSYGENTVAEHTFALILCLTRKIRQALDKVCKVDFQLAGLRGTDLKGKTIGIIGTGNIGRHVARIANGFQMKILACDPNKDCELPEKYGVAYVPLDQLFRQADIITFHAPYSKKTRHMLNMKNIRNLKKGALIINTARGGLIETEALVYGLDNGIIGGAGLDVLEGEAMIREEKELLTSKYNSGQLRTLVCDHILISRDNVVITPHNAFNSSEALMRILETTHQNIQAFAKKKPVNVVGGN